MYNKREMTESKYLVSDFFTEEQSDSDSEDYCEKCDHEYSVFSKGSRICLTCGLETREIRHVPEKGYEDRTIVQSKVSQTTDDLRVMIRSIFSRIGYLITVENSLEKLFETCETYILPDGTLVKEGKRKHPFRVSARPEGICAALLWREVLVHKLPITMAGFSREISVPRTTIIGAFKQLDDYSVLNVSKPGRPRKKR